MIGNVSWLDTVKSCYRVGSDNCNTYKKVLLKQQLAFNPVIDYVFYRRIFC